MTSMGSRGPRSPAPTAGRPEPLVVVEGPGGADTGRLRDRRLATGDRGRPRESRGTFQLGQALLRIGRPEQAAACLDRAEVIRLRTDELRRTVNTPTGRGRRTRPAKPWDASALSLACGRKGGRGTSWQPASTRFARARAALARLGEVTTPPPVHPRLRRDRGAAIDREPGDQAVRPRPPLRGRGTATWPRLPI